MKTVYTDEQQAVINHGKGPALCIATAGSGKSTALIARIGRLLKEGTRSEKICAITFSKKASEDLVYSKLRVDYLTRFPVCKAALPACTTVATDVHHKAGRGKYYLITTTWLPVCRKCHTWIENNPDGAKELGFSESRL
jgi:hypothetical protein